MKNLHDKFFLTLLFFAGISVSAANSEVSAIQVKPFRYPQIGFAVKYALINTHESHVVTVQQTKPTTKPEVLTFMSSDPPGAMGRHAGLFTLEVNGIDSRSLLIGNDRITKWSGKSSGAAGCEVLLNFDGAKIVVRFFMTPGSPLLKVTLLPAKEQLRPIKKIKLKLHACVKLLPDAKKSWDLNSYAREVITPKRKITQQSGRKFIRLEKDENALVLQDRFMDGSAPDKGDGPGFVVFDSEPILKMLLKNAVYQSIDIELNPDFKEFNLGFWISRKCYTNSAFAAWRQAHPEQFSLDR